ncbi:uncharacterized protein LOC116852342 [Odontomachus brunneus]|uniref:uncharacterized protein LOC116852342 n=1 Tax=Odontomachus brunneus TaxID=486640 RepID=UPI0013F28C9F|nr:uncharacterized protein LOC116852342 [Odontomachus brunneus]
MWPPRTANAANFIANYTNPNYDTWITFEVDLIKHCSSLESARKTAADSNYETIDEDRLGCGRRQHISHNRYSSEDEENNSVKSRPYKKKATHANKVVSAIPSCPDNFTFIEVPSINEGNNVRSINVTKKDIQSSQSSGDSGEKRKTYTNPQEISEIPIIFEDCGPSYEEISEESNTTIKYLKQITRMQATLLLTLQDIKERLSRVEDIMKNRTSVSNKNDNLIGHLLLLNTIGSIQDFDSFLRNTDEAVKQFKSFLLRIGGNNPRDNIQRILPKILTNECAMKCSWKGIRNNFKVADLFLIKIMRREII